MTIASVLAEKGGEVIAVRPDTTIQAIAELMSARRIGAVLVMDADGALAGIVSERDVVKALASRGAVVGTMLAEQVMTREVTTAPPDTTIEEALEIMDRGYFRHLPVLDGGKLIGVISVRDAVKARIRLQEHEADNMRSYIHGRH